MQLLSHLPQHLQERLIRAQHTGARGSRLRYRRIFLLPTRGGLVFGAMLFIMWLTAINYSNSLAFALCFLLLALGLVFMLHGFRNLLGLEIATRSPRPVFVGEPARFPLQLSDRDNRDRLGLELEAADGGSAQASLPAGGRTRVELAVPTQRRGRLRVPRIKLSSSYPAGLVRAWVWLRPEGECIVYPQPAGAVATPPAEGAGSGRREVSEGDFSGLRGYAPGDPLQRVDWRAVARGLPPHIKLFTEGGGGETLRLDWNALPPLDVEARLALLCRYLLDAEHAGLQYGMCLPTQEIAPGSGEQHLHQCLRALALFPS